jgi:outer membrane protein
VIERRAPWLSAAGALALAAFAGPARGDDGPPGEHGLTSLDVVTRVFAQNPTIAAALYECRRAAIDVEGEAARYPFVLRLDSSWTDAANPFLAPGVPSSTGTVVVPKQDDFDLGVQLAKHLVWGTDLALRVDATRQYGTQVFPYSSLGPLATALGLDPNAVSETSVGPGLGAALKLTLVQPLLRGSGPEISEMDLRTARVHFTLTELAREETASQVVRDSLVAYWELWYATASVEIERRARDTARRQSEEATARIQTGSLAPADGLALETELATREEDLDRASSERTRRAVALARLLGCAERPSSVEDPSDPPPEPADLGGDLSGDSLQASARLRALASEVELAAVRAESAGDALRPRLDVDAYLQAQGLGYDDAPAALKQLGGLEAVSGHVGLTFELPLDDTRHRAERDRAELAIEVARERFEEGRQEVLADLASARQAEASARRRVSLAEQTRLLASRQADAEHARFATGASTALQVLQAEDAVRAAELRLARARTDVVQAHLAVAHLAGRLLEQVARAGDARGCFTK